MYVILLCYVSAMLCCTYSLLIHWAVYFMVIFILRVGSTHGERKAGSPDSTRSREAEVHKGARRKIDGFSMVSTCLGCILQGGMTHGYLEIHAVM